MFKKPRRCLSYKALSTVPSTLSTVPSTSSTVPTTLSAEPSTSSTATPTLLVEPSSPSDLSSETVSSSTESESSDVESPVQSRLFDINEWNHASDPEDEFWEVLYQHDNVGMLCSLVSDLMAVIPVLIGLIYIISRNARNEKKKLEIIISAMLKELTRSRQQFHRMNGKLQRQKRKCQCDKTLYEKLSVDDKSTKFYTGLESKEQFSSIYDSIKEYVRRRWTGLKTTTVSLKRTFDKIMGPQRILHRKDELLLCLRLGFLDKDIHDRFGISNNLSSTNIFIMVACISYNYWEMVCFHPQSRSFKCHQATTFQISKKFTINH